MVWKVIIVLWKLVAKFKKVRTHFGIPWILWSALLTYAILSDPNGDNPTLGSKLKTLAIASIFLILLPWFFRRRRRKKIARRKAKALQARLHAKSLTGRAKLWHRTQIFLQIILFVAHIYAAYKVITHFIPPLSKYADAQTFTDTGDLSGVFKFFAQIWPGMWDIILNTLLHTGAGQYLIASSTVGISLWIYRFGKKIREISFTKSG